ncbi:hypothetical protein [Paraburkholderia tagetis]|uniref:Uncharacterized protein n=1 Tax=Paraburkholderia tagetis TaxID=2913261 RepID=A0A9X1UKY8_9BURK|nr:hypothetical protein [Paraburkholderia tagetis]MCG5076601.1 hypothetical protein [Paraburkholderia tagetis]
MPSDPRSPVSPSGRLPAGVLGRDYLKFLQLSVDDEFPVEESLDDVALEDALAAIRCGSMRAVRPAMKIFFDGCQFWIASHFHRYEAARRLGARHQEFWCEIQPGPKDHAVRYASRIPGILRFRRDPSTPAG